MMLLVETIDFGQYWQELLVGSGIVVPITFAMGYKYIKNKLVSHSECNWHYNYIRYGIQIY